MIEDSHRRQVFIASFLTLIVAGVGFAIRNGTLQIWAKSYGFTNTELGEITGMGFVGFGIVILVGSVIAERINYKTVFLVAFVLHVLSAVITLAATPVYNAFGREATYWCLYVGVFVFAVANGLCEAVINPLAAALYPKQKTHYLNILHAGWPGGMILGGLVAAAFLGENAWVKEVRWELIMGLYLLPAIWYGLIVLKEKIPPSEAGAAGVSFGEMLKALAAPLLLFLLVLHACVGYVELGTDSWIARITDTFLSGQGLLLFVYASLIMFILRFFAGPIVEKINPLGLLCVSSILGAVGLYTLASAEAAAMIWLAVTVYGIGKTFLWPTMLGVVGEQFPRGGALAMGAIGGVGTISAGLLGGPGIGYEQDLNASRQLTQEAPATYERYAAERPKGFLFFPKVNGLDGQKVGTLLEYDPQGEWTPGTKLAKDYQAFSERGSIPKEIEALYTWWESAQATKDEDHKPVEQATIFGSRMALKWTSVVPAAMFVGYLLLVFYFAAKGGYQAIHIDSQTRNDSG